MPDAARAGNDNLWIALAHARDAPEPAIAIRLGAALGWYFAVAERVSEGRRFLELALAASSEDAPVNLRIELLAGLCFLATEELDLDAAIDAGERALALARAAPASSGSVLAQATLSLALAYSGDKERAVMLAEDVCASAEAAGSHWDLALASLLRAIGAARRGSELGADALASKDLPHAERKGRVITELPPRGCTKTSSNGRAPRPRQAPESLNIALAGSPAATALLGVAELADARGDPAAAHELRADARLSAAGAPGDSALRLSTR
jgi:hypothetical protein